MGTLRQAFHGHCDPLARKCDTPPEPTRGPCRRIAVVAPILDLTQRLIRQRFKRARPFRKLDLDSNEGSTFQRVERSEATGDNVDWLKTDIVSPVARLAVRQWIGVTGNAEAQAEKEQMTGVLRDKIERTSRAQDHGIKLASNGLFVAGTEHPMKCRQSRFATCGRREAPNNFVAEQLGDLAVGNTEGTKRHVVIRLLGKVGRKVTSQVEHAPQRARTHPDIGEHHTEIERGGYISLGLEQ